MSAIIEVKDLNLWYGAHHALHSVNIDIPEHEITALIGPSGCGKSTFLKTLDRMNDLVQGVKIKGTVAYRGQDIYAPGVDDLAAQADRHGVPEAQSLSHEHL